MAFWICWWSCELLTCLASSIFLLRSLDMAFLRSSSFLIKRWVHARRGHCRDSPSARGYAQAASSPLSSLMISEWSGSRVSSSAAPPRDSGMIHHCIYPLVCRIFEVSTYWESSLALVLLFNWQYAELDNCHILLPPPSSSTSAETQAEVGQRRTQKKRGLIRSSVSTIEKSQG